MGRVLSPFISAHGSLLPATLAIAILQYCASLPLGVGDARHNFSGVECIFFM